MTDGLSIDRVIGQKGPTYGIRCIWYIKKTKIREAKVAYIDRSDILTCLWTIPAQNLMGELNSEVIEWNIQPVSSELDICFWLCNELIEASHSTSADFEA